MDVMNAMDAPQAAMKRNAPNGLSGVIVTKRVKRKAAVKERKLELGSVRKKELVESGRQVEKRRRRWRQRHAIGFPCARRGVEVDAVVGWSGESARRLAEEGYSIGTAIKEGWKKR